MKSKNYICIYIRDYIVVTIYCSLVGGLVGLLISVIAFRDLFLEVASGVAIGNFFGGAWGILFGWMVLRVGVLRSFFVPGIVFFSALLPAFYQLPGMALISGVGACLFVATPLMLFKYLSEQEI